MSDPIERVARVIGCKPGSSMHSAIAFAIHEHARWLTEQGIPVDKLLSGEMVAQPVSGEVVAVPIAWPLPSENPAYDAAFKERHGRTTDGLELDSQLWRWLKIGHEATIEKAIKQAQLDYAGNPPVTPDLAQTERQEKTAQEPTGATHSQRWTLTGPAQPPEE